MEQYFARRRDMFLQCVVPRDDQVNVMFPLGESSTSKIDHEQVASQLVISQ